MNTDTPFDFFKDLSEDEQNSFLKEYLTKHTKYLKEFQFPNSKSCFYYLPEFRDDQYHGNSITNLASLLMLLLTRNILLPIRFLDKAGTGTLTRTPQIYYIFSDWPVGNLHDNDFYSFEMVQDHELIQYANALSN